MKIATADLCDANEKSNTIQLVEPVFRHFGAINNFYGAIRTVATLEDNSKVKEILQEDGEGQVLVVDGAASKRCALLGGNLAKLAFDNNWQGIIVNGCVRDCDEIAEINIGVMALTSIPKRCTRLGLGTCDVTVKFAGCTFVTGEYIYADSDGIVINSIPLH